MSNTQADRLAEQIKHLAAPNAILCSRHIHDLVDQLAALAKQPATEPCSVCNALIVPRNATHHDATDLAAAQVRGRLMAESLKVEQQASPEALCACKDRSASACPGEWEPGCDLGNNPAHVRVHIPPSAPKCEQAAGAAGAEAVLRDAWAGYVNLSADMEAGPLRQQMRAHAKRIGQYLADTPPSAPQCEQAAGAAEWKPSTRMWHDRIKDAHPNSEPEYWPMSLKLTYMEDEITDLRALVQGTTPATGGVQISAERVNEIIAKQFSHDGIGAFNAQIAVRAILAEAGIKEKT